jgi:transcription-repair coupling factor (superfamily II helicase)
LSTLWEGLLGLLRASAGEALEVGSGSGRVVRFGSVPRAAWAPLAGSVARAAGAAGVPCLVLVPGPERFLGLIRPWLAGRPASHLFAEVGVSFLDRPPAQDEAVGRRLEALAALAAWEGAGQAPASGLVVISSRRGAMRPTLSPAGLRDARVELWPGLRLDPPTVAERLVGLGYSREPLAVSAGQFSLRGGILDVYPGTGSPVRAEWLGEEVETLRVYDPETQRSVIPVASLTVLPGRELLLGAERGQAAAADVRGGADLARLRGDVRADWEADLERLAAGASFPGVELYAGYLEPGLPSLFDHLPAGTVVVDLEPERQLADVRQLEEEALGLGQAENRHGELPAGFRLPMVAVARLETPGSGLRVEVRASDFSGALDAGFGELEPLVGRPRAFAELAALGSAPPGGGMVTVLASEQGSRLGALLAETGEGPFADRAVGPAEAELDLDLDLDPAPALGLADLDLPAGFAVPALGLRVYSDAELFGRVRRPAQRLGRRAGGEASFALEFQPGELVVHVDHGISRFQGMKLIESDGVDREYLELEYAEGDRLFVPVESLDRVQKYLGGGDGHPVLHRLGTGDWERARSRARRSVQDVAEELLKIYSQREARPGIAFEPDGAWQGELEASFPYEETPDQVAAMADIKADMEMARPMDRLLCGDVGFGKTELAVRAALKAVLSGRQVALLAPTTVLVQQHFQVLSERLKTFPVQVEVLSRFRTEEQQARTLAGLKAGAVDIVIGTHRLLQRDVRFKRLGLLIVDEEQRFGVMQKERLKKMRTNVDVLSLSATPIPRTMHMALSQIRDMSVIQTPPEERQPIKTYVTADDDELVTEVIGRELDRGGQVYFVHNRVRTIERAAERIRQLVPRARVAIGHGQMDEVQLARVMVEFGAGEFDVLVCTTIIESGLDIPNVNTIMVERADRFGLAQLYQLRGRVGRAGRRAYAYFLYDPRRSLTEAADKRLDVISGLHELGQGFKIALRDLEIRGAGNLLGTEQHGAIAAVGFEMYMQMLQSAVARLRQGGDEAAVTDVLSTAEMNIDLTLDHFIPRSYIRDERLRLGAYRQLAAAADEAGLEAVLRSLRDRYGAPPTQLDNLAFSLRVKLRGQRLALRSVTAGGSEVVVRVDPQRLLDVEELRRRFAGRLTVGPNRLRLTSRPGGDVTDSWRQDLILLLDAMEELYERATIPTGV